MSTGFVLYSLETIADLSKTSKNVMDATKSAASTTRSQNDTMPAMNSKETYKEIIKESYKGVPSSLESQSLSTMTTSTSE